jgi:hypothetical protein
MIDVESYNKGHTKGWNSGYLYALREMQLKLQEKIATLEKELAKEDGEE